MARFTFTDASQEVFVVRLTDPELVAHARALLTGEEADPRIGGTVVKTPTPYNIGWSYHLDPESVFFFEMSTEVGDSTMRYIENHLDEVGGELLPGSVWTSWSSTLTGELNAERGGAGAEVVMGTAGADLLFGWAAADTLNGGLGDDHLACGAGDDLARGGSGNDKLGGHKGNDLLRGGDGRDLLDGGMADDKLNGGAGLDTFVFAAAFGADRVTDFDHNPTGGQDLLDLSAFDITAETFASHVTLTDLGADILVTIDNDAGQIIRLVGAQTVGNITAEDFILA